MKLPTHYVYILRSLKDQKLYVGYTNDLSRRLSEHSQGKNISTKNRRPLELIFHECFREKRDALKRESYFKTTAGKRALKLMLRTELQRENKTTH